MDITGREIVARVWANGEYNAPMFRRDAECQYSSLQLPVFSVAVSELALLIEALCEE